MLKNFKLFKKIKKETLALQEDKNKYPELIVDNPKTAILERKIMIKNSCVMYTPFGLCAISDCLQCENSSYKIVFDNGVCLKTNEFDDVRKDVERYLLEFEDEIDRDIFEYLVDGNSDYRITRMNDGVVLRCTKEEFFSEYGRYPKEVTSKINEENRKRLVLKNK